VVPLDAAHRPFVPRTDACYLITGGFGGIGIALARWLVARGAKDLLLMGRTPRDLPEMAAWRERGIRVRAVAADVADATAVASALAGVRIAGVFHAAGIQDDALLFQQEWSRFEAVARAKVDGAQVLREALRGQPLDTFVLFSSVATMSGLVGAGAYVAANAALVALAARWRAENVPALCVQWGTWEGSGMARAGGEGLAAHWEALGLMPFPATNGIAALESLIAANAPHAIAARIDWARLADWAAREGGGAAMYATRLHSGDRPRGQTSGPVPGADLPQLVRGVVARVLGRAEDDPALERPFGELGLASLAAMELRAQLSARLGIPVPATLAFNHPSVDAVVKFLAKRLSKDAVPS
jgi:NAD(P)-dependent dehydrogenase (short-subunit alcohol dehydrogenase family)/acyl carrier protein